MELLAVYEEMQRLSLQMQEAARQGDWDRLVALQETRAGITEVLLKQENDRLLGPADLAKKMALIRSILDADAETKPLTESWMGELREILGSIGKAKKLQNAYETT